MKSDKPFKKSLICGAVLYAVIAILLAATVVQNLSHWLGYAFPSCLFAAIITGIWGRFSKKPWSWLRFSLTVFIFYFVLASIAASGARSASNKNDPIPAEIDRKSFSVSLPKGWKERKLDFGDRDFVASFDNSASCMFTVLVRPKSDGVTAAAMLEAQTKPFKTNLADAKATEFTKWGQYQGNGVEIQGTLKRTSVRAQTFGFEEGSNICIIGEEANLSDYKTYADDFEKIRRTFKLK
jgi:hypothetical protein